MTLWPRKRAPLAQIAVCPSCACEVAVEVLIAWKHAGQERERAGVVCECVRCGARYTVLDNGGAIAYGRNRVATGQNLATARAGTDRVAGMPGGEGTEGGGSLFGDMVTNLDDPRF